MYCSSPSLIGENCRLRRAGYCLGSFVTLGEVLMSLLTLTAHCNEALNEAATTELVQLAHLVKSDGTKKTRRVREAYSSSFGCLLLARRLMTTKVRMVKPKSQRLGRP